MNARPETPGRTLEVLALALLLVALVAVTAIRIRTIDLPLERDEGEYAYAGQLLLDGIAPYKLAYNMKWPGTYAAYAAIMAVFGESIRAIRTGILLVTTLTAGFVFLLGRRAWGLGAGAVAAASYLALSVSIESLGLFGHATHFVALCAAAGFLLLTRERAWAVAAAGAVLALAAVMKQPGVFFGVAAAVWLASRKAWRDLALLAAGAVAMLGVTLGALWQAGVFERFWFWTVDYAREYGNAVTMADAKEMAFSSIALLFDAAPLLWIFVAAGFFFLRNFRAAILLLTAAGILAVLPGFHFRSHYFIVLFPAAALLAGAAVSGASESLSRKGALRLVPIALFALALLLAIRGQWKQTSIEDMNVLSRVIYGGEPFPESVAVADYIRKHSRPEDRIAVLGSEPQIYFYADRKSATAYLYGYPLMEPQKFASRMQQEMIAEITKARPEYIVIVNVRSSWGMFAESDRSIIQWMWSLREPEWRVVGVAEMRDGPTNYVWGEAARNYRAQPDYTLTVLKRN